MFIDNAKYEWNDSKWLNVDLPNLTSIKSVGESFYNTRSLTLESIYQYWILIILDIPNLRDVKLNNSFKNVIHPVIQSIFVTILWI